MWVVIAKFGFLEPIFREVLWPFHPWNHCFVEPELSVESGDETVYIHNLEEVSLWISIHIKPGKTAMCDTIFANVLKKT